MKISKWLLTSTLAAAIAFTSLSVIASANEATEPEAGEKQQHMEEVKAAVESGDYNAFAEVAPEKMLEYINADNFGRFVEMHNHLDSAKEIADELGLPKMKMQMKGKMHQNKGGKLMENKEEIRAAVEAGDYDAWYELVTQDDRGGKILEYINEDNFSKLGELHEALQNEDFETAKSIKAELGLPDRPEKGQGHRQMQGANQ